MRHGPQQQRCSADVISAAIITMAEESRASIGKPRAARPNRTETKPMRYRGPTPSARIWRRNRDGCMSHFRFPFPFLSFTPGSSPLVNSMPTFSRALRMA